MGQVQRIVIGTLLFLGLVLMYWYFMVSQGVYFGRRMVLWFYDMGARLYDPAKRNTPAEEWAFLGAPISERLLRDAGPHPLLLDVAVGTARLPLALFATPSYQGTVVGIDISRKMLAEAARKVAPYGEHATLLHHPSLPLPFGDASFDAVTCIEALELMPKWKDVLGEMVRVLRPGGWLAITNRIGPTARMMPGQVESTERLSAFLRSLGLVEVEPQPWKKHYFGMPYYELVLARKPLDPASEPAPRDGWLAALRCPHCGQQGHGEVEPEQWRCSACGGTVRIEEDGVWALLAESALSL